MLGPPWGDLQGDLQGDMRDLSSQPLDLGQSAQVVRVFHHEKPL
jgi:hypothetical protein